ncbi:hypothetical protein FIBSPDRAFT_990344 [Athelia psychrophila]|uniref:Uncharacterized protein n=1 Tax=Athelia psychrophila TaxID=1759441 RepID=A0A166WQL5_9AGAM|nr:hypothetical protein FIBSPDRAFT_990344 [Fibularhizoctonia sp. CBS 109695]
MILRVLSASIHNTHMHLYGQQRVHPPRIACVHEQPLPLYVASHCTRAGGLLGAVRTLFLSFPLSTFYQCLRVSPSLFRSSSSFTLFLPLLAHMCSCFRTYICLSVSTVLLTGHAGAGKTSVAKAVTQRVYIDPRVYTCMFPLPSPTSLPITTTSSRPHSPLVTSHVHY